MTGVSWFAQLLVIIGALNWGLVGFFRFDLVAALFGGQSAFLSRVIYALIGLSGIVAIGLLGRIGERGARANRDEVR
jgi:uncharacterized membrane protein YuzA (DUF378 family)